MKLRSRVIAGIMSMTLVATMIGCSSSESSTSSSDEKITITVATYSDPDEVEIVEQQAAAYMEQNENVEIVVEPISGDIWEVLKTRMAANEEPDIFYMELFQVEQFIDAGKLASLSDMFTEEELEDFNETLIAGFTGEDGELYGIPKDYSTLALYYNVEMFEEAGLEPPTTWEELEEVAAALTTDDVIGLTLQNELARCQPFFYSNGGGMMDGDTVTFNSEENIEAYEFWISLFFNGYADTPANLGYGWSGDTFAAGAAAMTIEGSWMVNSMMELNPDLEYGVVEIPIAEGGTEASMQFTVAYSMSTNTAYPEVAMDVIEFLTSYEQQLVVAEAGRSMPSRTSALEEYVELYPERQVFVDVTTYASEYNYGIVSSTVVTETSSAMEKVLLDPTTTVQEAFDEAQENIEAALEAYN